MNCPNCNAELLMKAALPETERMSFELTKQDNAFFCASTIGSALVNLDKALKATAKHLGGKIEVGVEGISLEGNMVKFHLICVDIAAKKPKKGKQAAE